MFPQIKVDLIESESGSEKHESSFQSIKKKAAKEHIAEKEAKSKASTQSKKNSERRDRTSPGEKRVKSGSSHGSGRPTHRLSVPPSHTTSETFSNDNIWSEKSSETAGSNSGVGSERSRIKTSKHVRIGGKSADRQDSGAFEKRKDTEKLDIGAVANGKSAENVDVSVADSEKNADKLNNKPEKSRRRRSNVSNMPEKIAEERLGSPVRSEKSPDRLTVTKERNPVTPEIGAVRLGINAFSAGNAFGTDSVTVKPAVNGHEQRSTFDRLENSPCKPQKSIKRRSSENPKSKNVFEFQKDDPHLSKHRSSSIDSNNLNYGNRLRLSTFQKNPFTLDDGRESRTKTTTGTPNYINMPVDSKARLRSKTYGVPANIGESSSPYTGNYPVCDGGGIYTGVIDADGNYAAHRGSGAYVDAGRSDSRKSSQMAGGGSSAAASGLYGAGTGDITASSPTLDQLGVPHSPGTISRKSNKGVVSDSIGVPLNKMSLKLYGSKKAVQEEQERLEKAGAWIIHPYSNFRLIWDTLTLLLLLVNITLIPVAIAYWKLDQPGWLPFKCFTDVWFLIDILLNFRTGIVFDGPDSEVILNPREIKDIYLRTWFAIDIISTFPFDLFFTIVNSVTFSPNSSVKALSLLRLAKILSLLRLLRLSRFIRYVKQWEEIFNFQYEIALAFARITNLILLMFFLCHFNGCLQYMIPMFLDFPKDTWVSVRNLNAVNVTVWERYSWSVFKSTSHMLCIGYGQFPPRGLTDLWVTYVSMCSGAMCFALFIGNATSLIQSMDTSKRAYKEKFVQVKEYMQFRKLPTAIRRKMADYYENRFQGKMFDEQKILSELNHSLREEIINATCRELVEQVPLFRDVDPYFLTVLLTKLEFEVFLAKETIIQEGALSDKMYFISRGTVLVRSQSLHIEAYISDGGFFGERALIVPSSRRVADVIAESYCYLYSLSWTNFMKVLKEFPQQRNKINENIFRRMNDTSSEPRTANHQATDPSLYELSEVDDVELREQLSSEQYRSAT